MNSAQLTASIKRAAKFYLHRLLIERMHKLASDETLWQVEDVAYTKSAAAEEPEFPGDPLLLHRSIDGLLKYEKALKVMAQSLREKEVSAYAKQFKDQHSALDQCTGHLWSQFDQPPYVEDLNALFAGHNIMGEMFRRDAFQRVEQQIEKQWPHVKSLKRIFKESPPPELYESPKIKAVIEFQKSAKNPNLSVTEYQQAIKKLQQEVFGGSK